MAARNYPADTRLQKFYTEQYDKENIARLEWYIATKRGGPEAKHNSGQAQHKGRPKCA